MVEVAGFRWEDRSYRNLSAVADAEAGGIDVVMVYKIGRLTRSLADFARIAATAIEQLVACTLERLLPGKDAGARCSLST